MPHKDPEARKAYSKAYREKYKERHKEYQQAYRKEHNFSHYKQQYYKLKKFKKYGITRTDFEVLLDKQGHRCAICEVAFSIDQRPHIDHCHTTGKVRGLLCLNCNTGIGQLRDKPALVYRALCYLEGINE